MTDNHPDAVLVEVGGTEYHSKLSVLAIDNAETRHGYKIRFSDLQDPSMGSLSRLAWVSFLHDSPDLSFEDFTALDLPLSKIMEIASQVVESLTEGPAGSGSPKSGKGKPRKK